MTRLSFFRSLAVALGASSVVAACGGGNAPSEQLAADQTLSFPMVNEFADLDPGHMSAAQDVDAFRNVYSACTSSTTTSTRSPTSPPELRRSRTTRRPIRSPCA